MTGIRIRDAAPEDAPVLCGLIRGLAEYERLSHEADPDPVALSRHLAGVDGPRCFALIAEDEPSGDAVGFALFFPNYSTFLTGWGIYLEDLFVRPDRRGNGIGRALLARVARFARDRGAKRLDWSVLEWNRDAIGFYESLGARAMSDWRIMRVTGNALETLARTEPGPDP